MFNFARSIRIGAWYSCERIGGIVQSSSNKLDPLLNAGHDRILANPNRGNRDMRGILRFADGRKT